MAKQKMAKTITKQKRKELRHKLYVCIAEHVDSLLITKERITIYVVNVTKEEELAIRSVPKLYCFNVQPQFWYREDIYEVENLLDFKETIGI
jgi:hypothetical protein